jgi:hypothetical protein
MIVVVEGISASGKSTWCARHGAGHIVPETGRLASPDRDKDPSGCAQFWADQNARRWSAALVMESDNDPAICDSDPLKLHYAWGLWQIGEISEEQWNYERAATRQALVDQRIGFADAYIVGAIDPEIAQRQRDSDHTRIRRNFALHLRLQPSLLAWYRTLDSVLPCEVIFNFPEQSPASFISHPGARYDVTLFDKAMTSLLHLS